MKKVILLVCILVSAILAGCGARAGAVLEAQAAETSAEAKADNAEPDDVKTVTVSGKSSIYSTPDKAEVNFGVRTRESEAAAAQEKNAQTVDQVIKALKDLGIDAKSIRTTGYNIWQEYNYETDQIRGYTVTTNLTVKDLEIDLAGEVITTAVANGVNEMNGISYSCSDYYECYEKALEAAVDAAKKKAQVLAKAAGSEVGDVKAVVEGYQDMSARYSNSSISMDAAAEKSMGSMAAGVLPGESEISAEVTVTWYLR